MLPPDVSPHFIAFIDLLVTVSAIALLVVAGYGDIRTRRISNNIIAAIAILGIARLVLLGNPTVAAFTAGAAFLTLLVTFLLFLPGIIGGGDAKLLTAAVLVVGYHHLFPFFLIMSVCGVVVSTMIIVRYSRPRPTVPYAVAIAAGAILTTFL